MTGNDPVYDAMALAVCNERWLGSTANHHKRLQRAWNMAWGMDRPGRAFDSSEHWDAAMLRVYADEIAQFDALSMAELKATLKLMTYESGEAFYCAVMALTLKLRRGERYENVRT